MLQFWRAVFRSKAVVIVLIGVLLAAAEAPVFAGTEDEEEQAPVVVPEDVHIPKGTKIPVMWKVTPGKVRFYSAHSDPDGIAGGYTIKVENDPSYDIQSVSMYSAPTFRMKCRKKHLFYASPFESKYPEEYRVFIPCKKGASTPVGGKISKVLVTKRKVRVSGTATPASKVKSVRVALYRHGKSVKKVGKTKKITLIRKKSVWKTVFLRGLRKGTYVVRVRVVAKSGQSKVVKRRIVVC